MRHAASHAALGGRCHGRRGSRPRQAIEDGALRPVVPVAAVHEVFEGRLHGQQLGGLLLEFADVCFGQGLDLAARAARWSGNTRDWSHIGAVTLNPERDAVVRMAASAQHTQQKAA